jgi:hypothetical protein
VNEERDEFEERLGQRVGRFADAGMSAKTPDDVAMSAMRARRRRIGSVRDAAGLLVVAVVVILLAAAGGLALIGSRPSPRPATVTIPPNSALPAVVLDAYLRALQAGDCRTVSQLTNPLVLNQEYVDLCAVTRVTAFSIQGDPVVVDPDTVRLRATITITGTANGILPGEIAETFFVQRQLSGAWRIIAGYVATPPSMLPLPTPPT